MEKTTVLVTGATGFIGSHILEALATRTNINVIAACRDKSKLLPGFNGEIRQGNLTDGDYISQLTHSVDVICHAAAWTSLWAHRKEEQRLYRDPSKTLIDAAIKSGVKRFIFDSSVVVVGAHRDGTSVADHEPAIHPRFWPHMDIVVDIEKHMLNKSEQGMTMVALRCGHFVGERYNLGLLSLLLPRLKTHMVPWVAKGKSRVPLVHAKDVAKAYMLSTITDNLTGFCSFNICGPSFPTMKEVIEFLHTETGVPKPHFGVPIWGAYMFGWLMEKLNFILPGDPFLTRAIVYLGEDWHAPSDLAKKQLAYIPETDWREAIRIQLRDMESHGYPHTPLVDGLRWWSR